MFRYVALLCVCTLTPTLAQDDAETQKLRTEVTQLRNQLTSLRKKVQELQRSLGQTAQRGDARKERLAQREAELSELRATVKELLPNTTRYPKLAQRVPGFAAEGSLRGTVETLAEATDVAISVHRSVPKGTQLNLTTCDLQLITVLELAIKNARTKDGEPITLAWTWRKSRGVEIRAVSKD